MTSGEPAPRGGGTVGPTQAGTLAIAAVVGAGVGWLVFAGLDALGRPLPTIPLSAAFAEALTALVVAGFAVNTHRVVQKRRERLESRTAVTLLALGKTALVGGVALSAGYVAVAVYFWPRLDAALPRERVGASLLAALAGLGLAVAGFFLERACRIPRPPDDEDDNSATPPGNTADE